MDREASYVTRLTIIVEQLHICCQSLRSSQILLCILRYYGKGGRKKISNILVWKEHAKGESKCTGRDEGAGGGCLAKGMERTKSIGAERTKAGSESSLRAYFEISPGGIWR